MDIQDFIQDHLGDDVAELVLHRDRYPGVDIALAADCITARRKLRDKVPEWYANPRLIFPVPLSAEQCSSTTTAKYKAKLASESLESRGEALADLTGGLGVDSWKFASIAKRVLYNDMSPKLAEAARQNFAELGLDNVQISNEEITKDNIGQILDEFQPDIVFMDPARRSSSGSKVFKLADCCPNILELQDIILNHGCTLMLKLSPMADLTVLQTQLHHLREIHILGSNGECKELLTVQEKSKGSSSKTQENDLDPLQKPGVYVKNGQKCTSHPKNFQEPKIVVAEGSKTFSFYPDEEQNAREPRGATTGPIVTPTYLFQPGAALMKSGAFKLISSRYPGLEALGKDAHYYVGQEIIPDLSTFGKWLRIKEIHPFDNKSLKDLAKRYPKAALTARALPLNTEALRKKMGITEGGNVHLFALGTSQGRLMLVCTDPCS